MWEEITVPVAYTTDWKRGRKILLEEVEAATRGFGEESAEALAQMARRYLVQRNEIEPRVLLKLTDTWVELAARFVYPRSARALKSGVSENVLRRYAKDGITVASARARSSASRPCGWRACGA